MTNVLLIILGHSDMIVPEAVLVCNPSISQVHIITTENEKLPALAESIKTIFLAHYPEIELTITAVASIALPDTSEQHALFEEALFQWYISKSADSHPLVCISGGTKTMPATMQQAARYFGASDVFHVIANMPKAENPVTFEQAKLAVQEGKISRISLGAEPGWQPLKSLIAPKHFSPIAAPKAGQTWQLKLKPENTLVSDTIRKVMSRVRQQAMGERVVNLPFASLQLLSEEQLTWLQEPLGHESDRLWVERLPKVELHCHLGGFATHGILLQQVRDAAVNPNGLRTSGEVPAFPDKWPIPEVPIPLNHYMRLGNATGSGLLHDPGCLKKQVELLYKHFLEQNICYAEVRCSPDNYQAAGRSAWDVLNDIQTWFEACMEAATATGRFCQVNLLVIVTRKTAGDLSGISRHIALAITANRQRRVSVKHECLVVGIDLAGFENKETRAAYYAQDFLGVHRCGLAVTAHAGENDDAEGIWQAVYHLHARRLGHALSLIDAPDLLRTVADRRIGVEMCPFANYQIKGFQPMKNQTNYPLLTYLEHGVLVTVNTDNIGISAASLTDNLCLLATLCPTITRLDLLRLQRNAIEVAFSSSLQRQKLMAQFDQLVLKSFG